MKTAQVQEQPDEQAQLDAAAAAALTAYEQAAQDRDAAQARFAAAEQALAEAHHAAETYRYEQAEQAIN